MYTEARQGPGTILMPVYCGFVLGPMQRKSEAILMHALKEWHVFGDLFDFIHSAYEILNALKHGTSMSSD